ncbi:beta-galactosidase [Bacteroides fragilis]|uniref:Beta-galactosidase n=3 Tax=Bacteroides fragilis TaxID=817 RepID=A0AB38PRM6_BACFG|nr:beta-galactosidase [Bacteroides fragilis]KAB5391264.1 beta-galactosidase [Bacteroides fragilis]TWV42177.1 beta-galactosidase [Bacteroides fragilis]TWV49878.1 beta-galactosidase [Bacteroides fragilis]
MKIFCLLLLLLCSMNSMSQEKIPFEIRDGHFYRYGETTPILSGEMHYARIPHQYWRHRLQMMKGMGLNAVATYVFWNLHEVEPGKWDFSGDKNLAEYIRIAGEEGMMVILRPGPYVCAEWEFGGYPWWLQNIPGMEIRRDNTEFLKYTKKYIDRLYQEVGPLQCTKGGPIIMVQCENEFGSYVSQRKDISFEEHCSYNAKIKGQLADAGFTVPLFTSDGSWLFEGGCVAGALPTANGESDIANLKKVVNQYHGGKGPYMVAEFYPGWLSHWGEPFPQVSASEIARQTEAYLQNDVSFNYYMVHGGTNFGFTSGANYDKKRDIQPDLTSYDYDAPISEAGWITPKYDSIRSVIQKYVKYPIPAPPAPIPVIEISSIKLERVVDALLLAQSIQPVNASTPLTFEQLNQGYGYVLYTRHFNQPISGILEIPGLRDYAVVYVDGEKIGVLNRNTRTYSMEIDIPFNATLQILVENMGRINYGSEIVYNTKGIISPVTVAGKEITGGWNMYRLPMDKCPVLTEFGDNVCRNTPLQAVQFKDRPVIYEGEFTLDQPGDTFIDMRAWGKGVIFINGKHIGRYWKVGPQQTLYIPGVWLRKGENKIVIFEQLNEVPQQNVNTVRKPVLMNLK